MDGFDVLAVASMSEGDREKAMGQVFEQLMPLSEEQQVSKFHELIGEMAEKASDEQYANLCSTNLKLASALPAPDLKKFLAVRMKAAARLPKNLSERDMKLLQASLAKCSPAIQEKISQNM